MTLIQVYALTIGAEEEKVNKCYGQFQSEINRTGKLPMMENGKPEWEM